MNKTFHTQLSTETPKSVLFRASRQMSRNRIGGSRGMQRAVDSEVIQNDGDSSMPEIGEIVDIPID